MFQAGLKGFSRKFEGCSIEVLRVFHGSFSCVSRRLMVFSRKFQGCFKKISGVFQMNLSVFQRRLKCVLKEL